MRLPLSPPNTHIFCSYFQRILLAACHYVCHRIHQSTAVFFRKQELKLCVKINKYTRLTNHIKFSLPLRALNCMTYFRKFGKIFTLSDIFKGPDYDLTGTYSYYIERNLLWKMLKAKKELNWQSLNTV